MISLLGLLKIFILFGIAVYLVFAVIVIKQVKIMNQTLKTEIAPVIKISSYVPLIFAFLIFVFALLSL